MSLTVLVLVQWLHILMGITWFGGYIFLDFVIWPTLLKRPAAEAKAVLVLTGKYTGPLMMVSGTLVILLGIVRGTLLGPITSFSFLFTTAYGLTWLTALTIALILSVWGANWHTRWLGPVWEEDNVRPAAIRRLRAGTIFEMACFGSILACMVLMGVGL
ncbi:MAG TPA: hypothetical protein VKB35_04890 [Ktedonobacteraceae bacterium]|nr:hypothetical protein [Ktedonobacteraceae bacterium]